MKKFAPDAKITLAVADDMTGAAIPASVLSHDGKPGLSRTQKSGATQVDSVLDFTKKNGNPLPANAEAKWAGALTVPSAGSYWIYLQLLSAAGSVSIDGKRLAGANGKVPQVYLAAPEQRPSGVDFPVHALATFGRVHLDAGQTREVSLHVPPRRLESWSSAENKWIKPGGAREVLVGGSSRDLPLSVKVAIQ
jgi:hypothetical protein